MGPWGNNQAIGSISSRAPTSRFFHAEGLLILKVRLSKKISTNSE
jgi:hypothetical protein